MTETTIKANPIVAQLASQLAAQLARSNESQATLKDVNARLAVLKAKLAAKASAAKSNKGSK